MRNSPSLTVGILGVCWLVGLPGYSANAQTRRDINPPVAKCNLTPDTIRIQKIRISALHNQLRRRC